MVIFLQFYVEKWIRKKEYTNKPFNDIFFSTIKLFKTLFIMLKTLDFTKNFTEKSCKAFKLSNAFTSDFQILSNVYFLKFCLHL